MHESTWIEINKAEKSEVKVIIFNLKICRSCWSSESPGKSAVFVTSSAAVQNKQRDQVHLLGRIGDYCLGLKTKQRKKAGDLYQIYRQQTTYQLQLSNGWTPKGLLEPYTRGSISATHLMCIILAYCTGRICYQAHMREVYLIKNTG